MTTSSPSRRGTQNRASFQRPRPKGLGQRIFRFVLLIFFVVLLSVLATLYFVWPDFSPASLSFGSKSQAQTVVNNADAEPAPRAKRVDVKPNFVEFEPFTVTLNQNGRSRILYVGITLQVADNDSSNLLNEYQPVVRDRILHVLSLQDPIEVQTPAGREELGQQLNEAISKPYPPAGLGPEINHVLFTTFVVQ